MGVVFRLYFVVGAFSSAGCSLESRQGDALLTWQNLVWVLSPKYPDALEGKGGTIGGLLLRYCFGLQSWRERKWVALLIFHL